MAVVNSTSNTVSIYRNTASSGSITTGSFASKVDFATGNFPNSVAIGDVDGDGKPDLIVTNTTDNTVSVLRNTASSGSITTSSFAAHVDFATGTSPQSVAIGDLDADGKLDLAIANFSTNVSVLRNTSSIGSISFAAKLDIAVGGGSQSIAIGDLDGDGKLDLALARGGLEVLRNTSSVGSISFAAYVSFTSGAVPYSVAIGDLDGDGKPDIAIANYVSATVSVFRNTATSGNLDNSSFTSKVDFVTSSGTASLAIGDFDGDGKPDLAAISNTNSKVSILRNTATSGTITTGSFAVKVDFATGTYPNGVAIGDLDGDGRPDVVTANNANTVSVLRNADIPTTISSFSPSSGPVGTLVTITGTNLSNPTSITIGAVSAVVISNTGTSLVAMVMPGASTGGISVTTANGTANATGNFTVTASQTPNAQQGNKLVGTGAVGAANQGQSIAVSADGNTAIVGGSNDNSGVGAAWVYTRSGSTWTQQGSKLVGTGTVGTVMHQGYRNSVAISADGNTAIVGGYYDNSGVGAAWVFTRSGSSWTQQGAKLVGTGNTGNANQGCSVALSADGNTAAIGGNSDNNAMGAVWIFTRSGSTWTQQGTKLVGTGATGTTVFQGQTVALSADGNTTLIGGYNDNNGVGAVWVFTRSGNTWTQQGTKLVGTGAIGSSRQGAAVALSADGNTAIVGGSADNGGIGGTWVFTRSGGTWTQQGNKLLGTDITGNNIQQGNSVAVSADGNTAVVGGSVDNISVGATWVFTRNGSNWTQAGHKLIATDGTGNTALGIAVAISADGNTAFAGGSNDNSGAGAAWAYTYVPSNTLDKLSLTGATPASAAYSLRKLSSSYTGNAILVRRSSDNSTQNIGFTGGGDLDTTALKTFAGSGDAFVVTWYDQSFVNDATQTTAASQPRIVAAGVVERLNGKPAVNFLGAQTLNISLYTNVVASGSNPSTINCVAKLNTNTGYQDVFSSGATVNSSPRSLGSTNNGLLYNSNGVNENDGIISSISQFIATGNFTSTNETLNSQNINPNGTLSTTSVATVPNSGLLLAAANIGSKASSQHIWNGYIQEITLFNSSLSNTDNTSVQNSQLTYYSGPQITASAISSALSTSAGTASSTANFTVSGAYMTAGILVTAPTGYEVSSSASGPFSSSLTVGAAGTIASTTVYIRLASTTAIGYYNGAIALTSSGATTANVLVGGTVLYAPPAISYGVTGTQVYSPGTIITPLNLSNTGGAVLAQAANGVSVFAGTSAFGSTDGPAASASFNSIGGIAIDTSGNVYVADQANSKIRKISAGTVSTFAGSGGGGLASNGNTVDGAAASATFYYPTGVAVDAAGNVFVADGNKIRKISAGVVSTFATISCKSLAVDAAGNLYVVSNSGDNKIYKITANGFVSTLAGNGSAGSVDGLAAAASFNGVYGIAVDAVGNVYVADANNSKVRKITAAGVVSTLAGSGSQGQMDGIGAAALFTYPTGIGTDAAGNVYVSENLNGWGTIRKITPDATVKTISSGWQYPNSIVTDKAFNVYWGLGAGNAGNQVILLSQQGYAISPALPAGLHFDSTNGKISGTPTAYSPATTYTITATNAGGSSTTTLSIQVTGSITAGTASGTMTTCVGSASVSPKIQQFTVSGAFLTDNILVTAPANFEVSLASGSGYGSTVTLNQSGGTVNSTTIYVRLAASATVGNKADSVVLTSTGGVTTQKVGVAGTVYQYPVLNPIQGTLSVCVGNTTTLTAVSPASVTTDTLHATNPKSLSIPTNTGSGTADQTMGNIAPVTFNAYQKIWSSDNPAVATVDATTGVVTGVSAGTANITCSVIGNCTTTQTAVVTVNPLPVLPAITGNTTVLVNSTSTLSNATTGGTWSSSNTAIATVISSTGVVKGITAGKDTITYAYTNGNGCSSSISTPINVVAIAPITGTTNVCAGSTTQLADATPNGTWSSSDVTKATIDATGTVTGISAGNVTITYTITGTGAVTTAFTVNALPIGSISAANGSIICGTGGSIVLTGSGGDTYAWTKGGTAITTTTASQLTVTAPAVYTATVTNSTTGCSAPAGNSITVTQLFAPKASFVYDSYCVNKPITFTNQSIVTTSGPVNYAWSDNNGNSSTGSNASFTYSSVGGYSVKLKVIPQVCPNIADSSTKVIPVESAIPGVRYPRIDAVVNNPTPLQARSFGSAYLWSPGTGISNTAIANPTVKIKTESNYTVQITVVSGCTTTDTVLVRAFDVNIYVPNVFSPNGDGINDVLYVNLINIKQLKFFRIYDRWGKKLFETNDPTQGWDGKTNGVLQHIDTYTWVAEAVDNNGTYVTKEGSVTLLR